MKTTPRETDTYAEDCRMVSLLWKNIKFTIFIAGLCEQKIRGGRLAGKLTAEHKEIHNPILEHHAREPSETVPKIQKSAMVGGAKRH